MTRIFISHLHRDRPIAEAIRNTLQEWRTPWGGDAEIYLSSSPDAGTPPGDDVLPDVKRRLAEASLVILVFTLAGHDWSWPWYEIGVATDLTDSDAPKKRIVVFQCTEDQPRLMGQFKRVMVSRKDSVAEFTHHYQTLDGFFPGTPALNRYLPAAALDALSDRFSQRLLGLLPEASKLSSAPVVSKRSLFDLERRKPGGILTDPGRVMIRSAQPMERNYEFASWIRENLLSDVSYRYYFSADVDLAPVALLVQALAVGGIEALREVDSRLSRMMEHSSEIIRNLELVRRNVSICFLTDPSPEEFVAYNWTDVNEARFYARYQSANCDGMVLLYSGNAAWRAAKRLDRLSDETVHGRTSSSLFSSTTEVPLDGHSNSQFLGRLREAIVRNFPPGLSKAALDCCFRQLGEVAET